MIKYLRKVERDIYQEHLKRKGFQGTVSCVNTEYYHIQHNMNIMNCEPLHWRILLNSKFYIFITHIFASLKFPNLAFLLQARQ